MSAGKANCLICGQPLKYFEEAQPVKCFICGKEETGHSLCEDGHYVCDACHRNNGVDHVLGYCKDCKSKNPIEIAIALMSDKSIYPNGPEHHTLIGAALMAAYKNAGGDIDLEKSLEELRRRSLMVPGGSCGFWGCCGAATSAGQFWSIVSKSTPMTKEPWGQCQKLTSRVLGDLGEMGGPRCCKRTGFTAILDCIDFAKEMHGIEMEKPEKVVCGFFNNNAECLKEHCPYYPQK